MYADLQTEQNQHKLQPIQMIEGTDSSYADIALA